MATFPDSPRAAFIEWCALHGPVFTANAAAIGLTPAQATAFNTALTAAQGKITAQGNAYNVARAATVETDEAVATLQEVAGNTVRLIRAFAEVQTKPTVVYSAAQIPPPATPSPVPPPGTPFEYRVQLLNGGALRIDWKCNNPKRASGVTYRVSRQTDGGAFAYVATVGQRSFTDTGIPSGAGIVVYKVQATRSTVSGIASDCLVQFGSGPSGGSSGGGLFIQGVENGTRVEADESMDASGSGGSTVNGKAVRKTLPGGNGTGARGKSRV